MDLGFGFCRLVIAVPEGSGIREVGEIKDGLVRLLKRDGFRSISEAVGSAG